MVQKMEFVMFVRFLTNGATNHSYCVTFQKYEKIKEEKKQEEEALKRK